VTTDWVEALIGDRFEWFCEPCNTVYPPTQSARVLYLCPICDKVCVPSSQNVRELNKLRADLAAMEYFGGETAQERDRYENALRSIRGPADASDPFMDAYAAAGGGYEGLQAIAAAALNQ
jgi:hypothetical protein